MQYLVQEQIYKSCSQTRENSIHFIAITQIYVPYILHAHCLWIVGVKVG